MVNPIQSIASFGIKILIWQANTQKEDVLTHDLYLPHGACQSPYIVRHMMTAE